MILTFELDKSGKMLHVFFDSEGRDMLTEALSHVTRERQHHHLMRIPGVNAVSSDMMTNHQFDRGSKPLDEVTFVYLSAKERPITEQFEENK
jgi:hypothetical protein